MSRIKTIWIYAEQSGGVVSPSFQELLGKARELTGGSLAGARVEAVLLGADNRAAADSILRSGADRIYSVTGPALDHYDPELLASALASLAERHQPDALWIACTDEGAELAPTVAAKLHTGLAAHCVDIRVGEDGELIHLVPAFGGRVLNEILIPNARPRMATVKPGIFAPFSGSSDSTAEVVEEAATAPQSQRAGLEYLGAEELPRDTLPVETAEAVVVGGYGIKTKENWAKLKQFASSIHAAVGYTRPVVDIGLENTEANMIGASGKVVHPKVYLGFGVSGASHHLCGMKDSGTIIAVNTDESADIFSASDYKAVADCGSVLDELNRLLG